MMRNRTGLQINKIKNLFLCLLISATRTKYYKNFGIKQLQFINVNGVPIKTDDTNNNTIKSQQYSDRGADLEKNPNF